jgi:hypothetical protein
MAAQINSKYLMIAQVFKNVQLLLIHHKETYMKLKI